VGIDPGNVLDTKDPGDDVQRRFRYQHAYAAIQCLKLLEPGAEFVAVYCENHEDVLLRRRNGLYVGVQVKTKKFDKEPFKSTDPAVMKSIARFAYLEHSFPGRFDAFHLVTNHGFWTEGEDERCLAFLKDRIRQRGGTKGLPKTNALKAYVATICEEHSCGEVHVVAALCKLSLMGFETDLERSYRDLRDVVGATGDLGSHSHATVRRIADNLVFLAYEASSLTPGGDAAQLYELVSDFEIHRQALLLAGKTITAERVQALIAEWITETADNLLVSARLVPEELLPPGFDVLVEKLERGGLQAARVDKVKDFKASMESLFLRWRYKHSVEEANRRLQHVLTLVEDDCIEAQIAVETDGTYAPAMYAVLRNRLAARVAGNGHPLFGATEEHLIGAAGILTEECRVWWSTRFELRSALRS
jgi:Cap4 dsDNA endonuclease